MSRSKNAKEQQIHFNILTFELVVEHRLRRMMGNLLHPLQ